MTATPIDDPCSVVLRPAIRADFDQLLAEPLPHRVRAFAAERGGELLAVGGLGFQPNDTVVAFLILNAPARTFAVSLHKAGKHMMNEARRLGIRQVLATAEPGNPAAIPWLERFGFQPFSIDEQNTVWVWSAD